MDTNILYNKSEENLKAAEKCVEENCYYAALSRLYYSIFQKIKYCIMTGKDNYYSYYKQHLGVRIVYTSKGETNTIPRGEFEHCKIAADLTKFLNITYSIDKTELSEHIRTINDMRVLREKADYSPDDITDIQNVPIQDLKNFVSKRIRKTKDLITYIDSIINEEEEKENEDENFSC